MLGAKLAAKEAKIAKDAEKLAAKEAKAAEKLALKLALKEAKAEKLAAKKTKASEKLATKILNNNNLTILTDNHDNLSLQMNLLSMITISIIMMKMMKMMKMKRNRNYSFPLNSINYLIDQHDNLYCPNLSFLRRWFHPPTPWMGFTHTPRNRFSIKSFYFSTTFNKFNFCYIIIIEYKSIQSNNFI